MLLNNRLLRWVLIASCLLTACVISLHAEETPAPQAAPAPSDMSKAMQHSMDPNVWMQMMAIMMNPQNSSSLDACALCHEPQEIAEYHASFGPMLDMMWQPYKAMMNPHAMTSMMNPNTYMGSFGGMMNPAMYMNMMYPMMGMMGPAMYMNMMYPMMGSMMEPCNGTDDGIHDESRDVYEHDESCNVHEHDEPHDGKSDDEPYGYDAPNAWLWRTITAVSRKPANGY